MKNRQEMSSWGIGPKIAIITIPFAGIMLFLHFWYYPLFVISQVSYFIFLISGIVCLAVGFPIWLTSALKIDRIFEKKTLATNGVYGIMRNPVYGGSYIFSVGVILFFRSFVMLAVPVIFYIVFRILVVKEEDYLRKNFGDQFEQYRDNINALFPTLHKIYCAFFYPSRTGKIQENLFAIKSRDANFFIYSDGDRLIAIDAGYRGKAGVNELGKIGIRPEKITHLFLTHTDPDHTGGLYHFPNAQVYLGVNEEQMITGKKYRFPLVYRNPALQRDYRLLDDGDTITAGSISIRAVAAPGHTPGHMAYIVNDKILFTGDALVLQNGFIAPFYCPFNMNGRKAMESVKRLVQLERVTMICTSHTGYTENCMFYFNDWKPLDHG